MKQQPILVTTFWMSVLHVGEHVQGVVQGVNQSEEYRSAPSDGTTIRHGIAQTTRLAERLIAQSVSGAQRANHRALGDIRHIAAHDLRDELLFFHAFPGDQGAVSNLGSRCPRSLRWRWCLNHLTCNMPRGTDRATFGHAPVTEQTKVLS